jgi:adenylate cyclase
MASQRAEPLKTRVSSRIAIVLSISIREADVKDSRPQLTTTLDISRTGVAFKAVRTYPVGMKLIVGFPDTVALPHVQSEILVEVTRVSIARRQEYRVGAQFTDSRRSSNLLTELLRVQMRIAQAMLQISNALSSTANTEKIVKAVSKAAACALGAAEVLLFTSDGSTNALRPLAPKPAAKVSIHLKKGLLGAAAASRNVTNVFSPAMHPLFMPEVDYFIRPTIRSLLCAPLRTKGSIRFGLLVAVNKNHGVFTQEDEIVAAAIGKQISAVLREALLLAQIKEMKVFNERILASMPTGVVGLGSAARLASANQSAATLFGFDLEKDIGKSIHDLIDRPANTRLLGLLDKSISSKIQRSAFDVHLQRKDKTASSVNLTIVPMQVSKGNSLRALMIAEDITKEHRLMNTLSRYLAREVAEQVLQENVQIKLGGTKIEVTILIADIRNFTPLSERMDPKELLDLLNEYFTPMINVIFRHHGMVDKFMGDALLAVFGVPFPSKDDSVRAVKAAIEMRYALAQINKKLFKQWNVSLEIGIGITSGTVISGNIGSARRMDFTVIGEPVNLASRLEGMTKQLERRILVSESVYGQVAGAVSCEFLGSFDVRGKAEKVAVYAI